MHAVENIAHQTGFHTSKQQPTLFVTFLKHLQIYWLDLSAPCSVTPYECVLYAVPFVHAICQALKFRYLLQGGPGPTEEEEWEGTEWGKELGQGAEIRREEVAEKAKVPRA